MAFFERLIAVEEACRVLPAETRLTVYRRCPVRMHGTARWPPKNFGTKRNFWGPFFEFLEICEFVLALDIFLH